MHTYPTCVTYHTHKLHTYAHTTNKTHAHTYHTYNRYKTHAQKYTHIPYTQHTYAYISHTYIHHIDTIDTCKYILPDAPHTMKRTRYSNKTLTRMVQVIPLFEGESQGVEVSKPQWV